VQLHVLHAEGVLRLGLHVDGGEDALLALNGDQSHPLTTSLADADVLLLIGCETDGSLVLTLFYHLVAVGQSALQERQVLLDASFLVPNPIHLHGVFQVQMIVLQLHIVAHNVGILTTVYLEKPIGGHLGEGCGKAQAKQKEGNNPFHHEGVLF
jgi:hypothetical protein